MEWIICDKKGGELKIKENEAIVRTDLSSENPELMTITKCVSEARLSQSVFIFSRILIGFLTGMA